MPNACPPEWEAAGRGSGTWEERKTGGRGAGMRPSLIACSRNALARLPRGGLWRWATLVPRLLMVRVGESGGEGGPERVRERVREPEAEWEPEAEEARGAARERERAQCPLGGEKPKSRLAACC